MSTFAENALFIAWLLSRIRHRARVLSLEENT